MDMKESNNETDWTTVTYQKIRPKKKKKPKTKIKKKKKK